MSRRVLHALVCSLSLVSTAAFAEAKFGYVDLQRALMEVDEGRAAKARLQELLQSKQKELDKQQDALKKEKDLLDKQASAMSEETRNQKMLELQKKFVDLQQTFQKNTQEMQKQEHDALQAIFAKMDPIIANIAQREGFTMVFEKTDSGLVYAPASLDLTNELVRLYNDQNKGSGGKSSKSTSSSKK